MKLASRHLWLFGRIELGLSREEFNALTPADWKVATKVWVEREKRKQEQADHLVARLAYFFNISVVPRKKGDKLPLLTDFLPRYGKTAKQAGRKPSYKELVQKIENHFGD